MKNRAGAAVLVLGCVVCVLDLAHVVVASGVAGSGSSRQAPAPAAATAATSSPTLRFVLGPHTRWLTPQLLSVHYELLNASGASVYVSQFPGPSVVATCETETGGIGGAAGGAWSKDGTLARKYYLQLAPGEALMGEAVVTVPAECRRNLQLLGVFQMEDGDDWKLAIPGRRIAADPLAVPIENRPRDAAARGGI